MPQDKSFSNIECGNKAKLSFRGLFAAGMLSCDLGSAKQKSSSKALLETE